MMSVNSGAKILIWESRSSLRQATEPSQGLRCPLYPRKAQTTAAKTFRKELTKTRNSLPVHFAIRGK